jgi:hypothetical protein
VWRVTVLDEAMTDRRIGLKEMFRSSCTKQLKGCEYGRKCVFRCAGYLARLQASAELQDAPTVHRNYSDVSIIPYFR